MPSIAGNCALCQQHKPLIESHVIPRTVIQWLKDTSGTGRLRRASEPNRPRQDGAKAYLLCAACDGGLLGPKEKWFVETMFRPYHQGPGRPRVALSYGPKLLYFAASLSFRVILLEQAWHTSRRGVNFKDFTVPLNYLRRYLRGLTTNTDGLEHHVILTSSLEDVICTTHTSEGVHVERGWAGSLGFDLMRGVDSVALDVMGHLVTLVKLPGFLFVTVLKPRRYRGFLGTRISPQGGTLALEPAQVLRSDLLDFLVGRSARLDGIAMSEAQADKVQQLIDRNPERWMASESARLLPHLRR